MVYAEARKAGVMHPDISQRPPKFPLLPRYISNQSFGRETDLYAAQVVRNHVKSYANGFPHQPGAKAHFDQDVGNWDDLSLLYPYVR